MNVSEGLIFHYFPSKEAILAEIVKRGTSRLDKDLAPVLEAPEGAGMDAVLLSVLQRYLEAIERNREFVALFFGEEAHNPEIRHSVEPVLDKLNQQLASYLAERQRLGFLRADIDPEAAARAFWTLLFGGARDVILSPESVSRVQHTLSTALSIFLSGLKR